MASSNEPAEQTPPPENGGSAQAGGSGSPSSSSTPSSSGSPSSSGTPSGSRSAADRSALVAVTVFPLLIVGGAIWAYFFPGTASNITPYTATLLGVIMFGMGLTLTFPDFKIVLTRPLPILIGVFAQYFIMPLTALLVVKLLDLPDGLAIGVILVGCAPGGTASNVIAYLAKADVALSITMTSVSTLLAPIMTPLLVRVLANTTFELDAAAMSLDIVKIVLVPVIGGLLVRSLLPGVVSKIQPILPWLSTLVITTVVAGLIPANIPVLSTAGPLAFAAVVIHNGLGLSLGYGLARLFRQSRRVARTVSIEVGMQNSGLAATLATTHFPQYPEAALPAAIFSVWHNISGAVLAFVYARINERERLSGQKQ